MISKWQKELALTGALVLLTGLAYGFLLERGTTPYSRHSDIVAQHLGMKEVGRRSLQAGHGLPLWKTDLLSGGPALTHPQALFTNPFQLLFLYMDAADAAGPTLWIHFLTMALSLQILGAAMGLGFAARAFMAVAGLFSFKLILIAYAAWLPVIPMFTCAPLLFAAVFATLDRPTPARALALAAVGTLCIHSGHLQIFYYALVLLIPYTLWRMSCGLRMDRSSEVAKLALWMGIASAIAVACSAYLMLPLAAEAPLTTRVEANYDFFLARPDFHLQHLSTFLRPEMLGTPLDDSYPQIELWEDVAYFGLLPQLLALVGVVLGQRRRYGRFLSLAFAVSILLAVPSPLTRLLFDYAPGFSLFRSPGRFLFLTTLLGIALAGIGLEELMARARLAAKWFPFVLAFALFLGTAAEGLYYVHRYLGVEVRDTVLPSPAYGDFFDEDAGIYRVAPIARPTLNYGWAASMDLELITGFDAYNYRHYQDYMSVLTRGRVTKVAPTVWTDVNAVARPDLLDALNVKYLVTHQALPQPPGYGLPVHFADQPFFVFYRGMTEGDLYIYENEAPRKRAFWADAIIHTSTRDEAIAAVQSTNLGSTAVIEWAGNPNSAVDSGSGGEVDVLESRGGFLSLDVRTEGRRYLVISEIWHPGWSASLDGVPVPLHRTNIALMGAWVPNGPHRLELEFHPLYWTTSLWISGGGVLSFALLAIFCLIDASRRKRWQ